MIVLRSAVFNLWFYLITLMYALTSLLLRLMGKEIARRWARSLASSWARSVLGSLRPLCGITYEVTGREHIPETGPALVASMHQSAFDTLVWLTLVPDAAYVLKKELLWLPLFGMMCRLTEMIAVDRGAGAAAIRDLMRGADRAVAQGRTMVIFPEGTRMPYGTIGVLQPGVVAMTARSRLPIIPVITDSGRCWGRRAFRKVPGIIHVAVLPPLPADIERNAVLARLATTFHAGACELEAGDKAVGERPSFLPI